MNNYSTTFLMKNICKQFIWKTLSFHKKGPKKNIAIISSRRSGSTLLMEILSCGSGIRYIDQPYSVYTNPIGFSDKIHPSSQGQITSIENVEIEKRLFDYTNKLLNGEFIVSAAWNPFKPTFHFFTDRVILKILSASALIEWFSEKFDMNIIYYTRHPIPQSLSCIRNNWGLDCNVFLSDDIFINTYLKNGLYDFSKNIIRNGSLFEKHILEWVLENLVPLRTLHAHPEWCFLSYEELVLKGDAIIKKMIGQLDISNYTKMLKQLKTPSISSKISEVRTIDTINDTLSDKQYLIGRWKTQVTKDQIRSVSNILERFGVDVYSAEDVLPLSLLEEKDI